jgi:alkaline phosphatase
VTTSRLTDATPAAAYAHSPWRFWEVDTDLPPDALGICTDLAKQLITDNPDIRVRALFGLPVQLG